MGLGIWVVIQLLTYVIRCSACSVEERNSLLDFRQGIDFSGYRGPSFPLESWKGFNCCAWEGVGCHPRTAHVLRLDLDSSNENHFAFGFVWSEIRQGLFQLLHLEYLDLSHNSFSSLSIPPQLGELRRLKYLRLYDTGFAGRIPRELAELQQLEYLDLNYNDLHGAIPKEIGNISTLRYLGFYGNDGLQSGNMREWITQLRGLEGLALARLNLTMEGPSWLGSIAALTNLTKINMGYCGLSGEIPPSFANLSGLQWLELPGNSLRDFRHAEQQIRDGMRSRNTTQMPKPMIIGY